MEIGELKMNKFILKILLRFPLQNCEIYTKNEN